MEYAGKMFAFGWDDRKLFLLSIMYFEISVLIVRDFFTGFINFSLDGGEFKTKIPVGLITLIINVFQTIQMYFQGCPFGLIWFRKMDGVEDERQKCQG